MRLAVPNVRFRKVQFKALVTAADPSRTREPAYEFSGGRTFKAPLRTTGPAPVSAAVLSSGTVLRVTYNKAIDGGSAITGFSWATGTLSSASYSGVTHDIVLASKIYDVDALASIVYTAHKNGLYGNGHPVASYSLAVTNSSTQEYAPEPVSATIQADGVTLRLVFDEPITSGSATLGFSHSEGSITSGAITSTQIDFVIPKTYRDEAGGTLTYSATTGTISGVTDEVASFSIAVTNNSTQWDLSRVPNIRDYGLRNLANIFTDISGTAQAVNNGDYVRNWRGENGHIVLTPSDTNYSYTLAADGVRDYNAGSGARPYDGSLNTTRPEASSCSVFTIIKIAAGKDKESFVGLDVRTGGSDVGCGFTGSPSGSTITSHSRGTSVSGMPFPSSWPGKHCFAMVFNGTAAWTWTDGVKTSRSAGTESDVFDSVRMYTTGASRDVTILAWGIVFGEIADETWTDIQAYAATL